MAIFDCRFRSERMGRDMRFMMVVPHEGSAYTLPNLRPKLVFGLHGIGGDYQQLSAKLPLELIANTYRLTFVLFQGDRSFYLNGFYPYEDYLLKDLIPYLEAHFQLPERKDWMIMGISMGGYGAMSLISKRPDLFHRACCLSPCLDAKQIIAMARVGKNRVGQEDLLFTQGFMTSETSDPALFSFSKSSEILIACGTEDPFYPGCLAYEKSLTEKGISVQTLFEKGGHDWFFWNKTIFRACCFLQGLPMKDLPTPPHEIDVGI